MCSITQWTLWLGTEANRERKYEQGDDYGSRHTGGDAYGGGKHTGGVASHVPGEQGLLVLTRLTLSAHNSHCGGRSSAFD